MIIRVARTQRGKGQSGLILALRNIAAALQSFVIDAEAEVAALKNFARKEGASDFVA